ncbi:MAG: cytochrome-c peroxidase [Deltaproteobacteria bacterium]|nr:cytochrome-c peroxidase [Deltaproteobacteria bacterium]
MGQRLFHDRGLAVNPKAAGLEFTYSCATCHHAAGGFGSGMLQGISEGGVGFGESGEGRRCDPNFVTTADFQPVRTPPALNLAWQRVMLWNGQFGAVGLNEGTEAAWVTGTPKAHNHLGFEGIETQAFAGMAVHRQLNPAMPDKNRNASIFTTPEYETLFERAFERAGESFSGVSEITTALAMAAYERTLLANRAPFQRWLRGENGTLRADELRGATLFFGKARCVECHTGPALNSDAFYRMGFADLDEAGKFHTLQEGELIKGKGEPTLGRGEFTGRAEDRFAFKVPQLYNLADQRFHGHGSSFGSVREVVEYKVEARSQHPAVQSLDIKPIDLSDAEVSDLVAFLEVGLYDPDLARYSPSELPSGLCGHTGDSAALTDLGCSP